MTRSADWHGKLSVFWGVSNEYQGAGNRLSWSETANPQQRRRVVVFVHHRECSREFWEEVENRKAALRVLQAEFQRRR